MTEHDSVCTCVGADEDGWLADSTLNVRCSRYKIAAIVVCQPVSLHVVMLELFGQVTCDPSKKSVPACTHGYFV